jgi:predicted MPP superfamily phosphohydrolase
VYLQSVVNTINDLKPDFVCFTGDIIEEAGFLREALELMSGIRAPLYGVPGNHDYWAKIDFGPVADAFASTGGKWLMDDQVLAAGGRVNIIGVTCNKAPLVTPERGVQNILLFHYPAWVQKLAGVQFDVMLAGHSHGGQVRLPFYGPLLVPFGVGEFDMGLYRTAAGPLYVNPGIGYFFANVRFCCRPEITVIDI